MLKTMRNAHASSDEIGLLLAALRAGIDPARLTRKLAAQHPGDASFARRLVDSASARLWLADGAPVADVLTMLEVRHRFERSPSDARAYAVEILFAVQHENDGYSTHSMPTKKAPPFAAA